MKIIRRSTVECDMGLLTVIGGEDGIVIECREVRADGERFTTFLDLDWVAARKLFLTLSEALENRP
jgi:hypothetical protein